MPGFYANWITKWEHELATKDTNRKVRPFDWGAGWLIQPSPNGDSPSVLGRFVDDAVQNSDAFYTAPAPTDFRLQGDHRGIIPAPILGDLAVFPADDAGHATAPEGFPIRRGRDRSLRAEAQLDLPPNVNARTISVKVEAISPSGKHVAIFQPPVSAPAGATEVKVPVVARIGPDWEQGVWMLRFTADNGFAGSGQFWLADDPEHFHFVMPTPVPHR